ncbi:MAG: outer membrane protein assembly factor BamD, partial [Proteobacteria bacterium]|nr:outer membrane protein assembly factor BamD [Pseudomonadota bacterium]
MVTLAWLAAAVLGLTTAGAWFGPSAGAADLRRAYDDAVRAYQAIKRAPVVPGHRTRWLLIINRFSRIYTADPRGPLADRAMYRLGQAYTELYRRYRRRTDLEHALDAYRRLVMRFPLSRLGDDAQYMIGHIQENLVKNDVKAFREYLKVELLFPRGDMVARARERLKII